MKNTMKFLGIIALVAVIGFAMAACDLASLIDEGEGENRSIPSGTFYLDLSGYNWSIHFADDGRFTLNMDGERVTGLCSLSSGNTFSLTSGGVSRYWTKVDSNTLKDDDGDYWRK